MKIVMKFGGTSMAGAEKIKHSASLALRAAKDHAVVTVVSAMDGVTEQLLELADAAAANNKAAVYTLLGAIRKSHEEAAKGLNASDRVEPLLGKLETLVNGIAAVGELTARSQDAVVSFGERLSTALMSAAMNCRGFSGQEVGIVTNDHFGEADPLMDLSLFQVRQTLEPLLAAKTPAVVSGFIAANQHGVTTTLGRGGSDYTATILGAAIKADEIQIWSDVDGMMTADPRLVSGAKLLDKITFAEAVEMGKFGAKSMHPRALEPASVHRIPVRMRNTFKPEGAGTLIGEKGGEGTVVRAVPMLKNMAMVTVGGAGMIGRPGTAAAVFSALAQNKPPINVHMICQSVSEAAISLAVSSAQVERAKAALHRALSGVAAANDIQVQDKVAIVAAVGSGMKGTRGVAARLFGAVAKRDINVIAIAQGSSELSVCFVVNGEAGPEAVKVLHEEFGLDR